VLLGIKDWALVKVAVVGDFTLVTHNSVDFRGNRAGESAGHYGELAIHAGLVCLGSVHAMSIPRQRRLFQLALEALAERTDLVNALLEIFEDEDGAVHLEIYDA
jgi:hypothetical protein